MALITNDTLCAEPGYESCFKQLMSEQDRVLFDLFKFLVIQVAYGLQCLCMGTYGW